jgi:hypothetical protein
VPSAFVARARLVRIGGCNSAKSCQSLRARAASTRTTSRTACALSDLQLPLPIEHLPHFHETHPRVDVGPGQAEEFTLAQTREDGGGNQRSEPLRCTVQ